MENKLRTLFTLQYIDDELDELDELKGDLPGEIHKLEERMTDLKTQHGTLEQTMRGAFAQRDQTDAEIITLREKLERYKVQQTSVRTNKEYDSLTKEMDNTTDAIGRHEKEMESLETKATVARTTIETLAAQIEELDKLLTEKRAELGEISKANEDHEKTFRKKRQETVVKIAKAELVMYERIRKAKRGKAVVPVTRGACGGCFNRVPPQMLLELKQNNRMYTCEHCGRILVSEEISASVVSGS